MHVALGSDHAGTSLRQSLGDWLRQAGHSVHDVGTFSSASVDYPVYAARTCRLVQQAQAPLGVLICGTGIGVSLAANRMPGIRAALCTNAYMARLARAHNDANVLCLGERVIGLGVAQEMVEIFLATPFAGGRHTRRLQQLEQMAELGAAAAPPSPP